MKTIDPPKKLEKREHAIRCKNKLCEAVMSCALDELKFHSDQRDGDAYAMTCPHCKHETWVNAELLR